MSADQLARLFRCWLIKRNQKSIQGYQASFFHVVKLRIFLDFSVGSSPFSSQIVTPL